MATTLAEDYLSGCGGSVTEYRYNLTHDQRIGQAFYNALHPIDQAKLMGKQCDPFYKVGPHAVEEAIKFLLDNQTISKE